MIYLVKHAPTKYVSVADFGFILDGSEGMYIGFEEVKKFLASIAKYFMLTKDTGRMGAILAGSGANMLMKLNSHSSDAEYQKAISEFQLIGFESFNLLPSLKAVYNDLFTKVNGGRRDIPKVLVILTASFGFESGEEEEIARKIKELGECCFSVVV